MQEKFLTVYGPVSSWRYGRSLGIDPIGEISTCSFNCVYCQLGEIEKLTKERKVFIPTQKIIEDLQQFSPWEVDVITLSGSGEPTLASNLGEIIQSIKILTQKPVIVLTNGTLLSNLTIRKELENCATVSVKFDGIFPEQLQKINRPVTDLTWQDIWQGIQEFRLEYLGKFSIQTMILSQWNQSLLERYIQLMQELNPDEIQLNIPSRPKPIKRQLDGRGNHSDQDHRPYQVRQLKCISPQKLVEIAKTIQEATAIPVNYPQLLPII